MIKKFLNTVYEIIDKNKEKIIIKELKILGLKIDKNKKVCLNDFKFLKEEKQGWKKMSLYLKDKMIINFIYKLKNNTRIG